MPTPAPARKPRRRPASAPARARAAAAPAPAISGPRSRALFARATRATPGGVNSPVRAWKRLGGQPLVISSGKGAYLTDADQRRYLDYVLSWGPLLHGHAAPAVVRAVRAAAGRGLGFGAPTAAETRLAETLSGALPGLELVRLVSSGTEACMSALRVARAATGRSLVVKCDGCYHGHSDALLVAAGSGCATLNTPDSSGVPADFSALTLSVPYNDLGAMRALFASHGPRLAALIIEPVAGNMGLILPQPGYLEGLRELCTAHGVVLIFDEVMSGFRAAWGGWQVAAGIVPDLTCLGKVIGGGLPVAAYGGRRELMQQLAPLGACYQAGTLSGNPVAVAAGQATLDLATAPGFYERHAARLSELLAGIAAQARARGIALQLSQAGLMWGYFFSVAPVRTLAEAQASDLARWRRFTVAMLRQRIYLAPSPFEAAFFSAAHGPREIAATLRASALALDACLGRGR